MSHSEDVLYRVLSSLQHKEFLYEQPAFPEVEYIFKHALTQEVAYNSVLIERRKALHEQVGQAIEQLFSDRLEEHYSDLAHHYNRSNNTREAVHYLHLAGHQAVQRSAHVEAINQLTTALELLKTLPDTPERTQRELAFLVTLGPALMTAKGFGSSEIEKTYTRARELCQQIGETPQIFPVLGGLRLFYTVRGEFQTARELGDQLLRFAQKEQDLTYLLEAHYALAEILFLHGELVLAGEHAEQAIALYDPQQHHSLAFLYGEDPGVVCFVWMAWILWLLGYPDQALNKVGETLALIRDLAHPYSLAYVLSHSAVIHQFRREGQAAQERAEAAMALAADQGFPFFSAMGTTVRGWALAEQGREKEGIAQIRQGLSMCQSIGGEAGFSIWLAAEAYGQAGHPEEGLSVLAEALALVDKIGERVYEAELYRLRGELTLAQFSAQSLGSSVPNTQHLTPNTQVEVEQVAEECFLKAIEVARHQQAKSLELRAVMSLSRLRQHQATQDASRTTQHATRVRLDEAHKLLSEIYNWFTEGFDTKDLQEAKALLESLSP